VSLNRSTLATFFAASAAVGSWLFFDQAKHNGMLSPHAGFLDDPYDAVGSFGVQIGAFAAFIAVVWFFVERRTHIPGWQERGVFVTAVTCLAVGISDLTGQMLTIGVASAGPWVISGMFLLVASGVGLILLNPHLLLNPHRGARLPSLLAMLGSSAPFGRQFFGWADRHPLLTGLGVGLSSGLALAISHEVLEGGPSDALSLILLSSIYIVGEGVVVAAGWFLIGNWLHIYTRPHKSTGG
jgi:hypothetical protein